MSFDPTPYLMKVQGGKLYLPTAFALLWFRTDYPDGQIVTEMLHYEHKGHVVFKATVRAVVVNDTGTYERIATGHAVQTPADFAKGYFEKCETKAIGRALRAFGIGVQYADDDEDGVLADSPQAPPSRPRGAYQSDDGSWQPAKSRPAPNSRLLTEAEALGGTLVESRTLQTADGYEMTQKTYDTASSASALPALQMGEAPTVWARVTQSVHDGSRVLIIHGLRCVAKPRANGHWRWETISGCPQHPEKKLHTVMTAQGAMQPWSHKDGDEVCTPELEGVAMDPVAVEYNGDEA